MSTNIAKGIEIARKATEYDTRGDYAKASELYVKSLDHFMAALKAERDPTRKDIIRNKIKEYLDRAEFIKRTFLHSGAASDPPTDPHPHQRCHSYSPTAPPAPAPVPPSAPLQQPGTATGGYYEQLIMQSMRYNDIVQECRRRRTKFTDPLFKADTSSLFKGSPTKDALELSREVVWMRATEKMGGRVSMFQQSIDPCDVVQGSLGDCWFL